MCNKKDFVPTGGPGRPSIPGSPFSPFFPWKETVWMNKIELKKRTAVSTSKHNSCLKPLREPYATVFLWEFRKPLLKKAAFIQEPWNPEQFNTEYREVYMTPTSLSVYIKVGVFCVRCGCFLYATQDWLHATCWVLFIRKRFKKFNDEQSLMYCLVIRINWNLCIIEFKLLFWQTASKLWIRAIEINGIELSWIEYCKSRWWLYLW